MKANINIQVGPILTTQDVVLALLYQFPDFTVQTANYMPVNGGYLVWMGIRVARGVTYLIKFGLNPGECTHPDLVNYMPSVPPT